MNEQIKSLKEQIAKFENDIKFAQNNYDKRSKLYKQNVLFANAMLIELNNQLNRCIA